MTDTVQAVVPFVEIDAANAESLKAWLDEYRETPVIRLDMSHVQFLDSSGVNALVRHVSERQPGDSVQLINVLLPVARVLHIAGLDRMIETPCARGGTRTHTPSGRRV